MTNEKSAVDLDALEKLYAWVSNGDEADLASLSEYIPYLAGELRQLRVENTNLRGELVKTMGERDFALANVRQLRAENDELRKIHEEQLHNDDNLKKAYWSNSIRNACERGVAWARVAELEAARDEEKRMHAEHEADMALELTAARAVVEERTARRIAEWLRRTRPSYAFTAEDIERGDWRR